MATFAASEKGLNNLWSRLQVTPSSDAAMTKVAQKVNSHRDRYKKIEKEVGVPWWWIGITHTRESNNDFDGILHNGEKIIGTGAKTKLEPDGRGPFASWEEAAVDALKLKDLDEVKEWSVARALYEWERFNGTGYQRKDLPGGPINTPYVFAHTNLQQRGKYTSDGNYDPNHWDTQPGTAAVLRKMIDLGMVDIDEPGEVEVLPPVVVLPGLPGGIDLGQIAVFLPIIIQVVTYIMTHENMTKEQQQAARQRLITDGIAVALQLLTKPQGGALPPAPPALQTGVSQLDLGNLVGTLLPLAGQLLPLFLGGPAGGVAGNVIGQLLQGLGQRR